MSENGLYKELVGFDPRTATPHHLQDSIRPDSGIISPNEQAVLLIQKVWRSYNMKKTYKWLRHNLYRAERMLAKDILKRLAPHEGNLLCDPTIKFKVRFRLDGQVFPPKIVYKIFTSGSKVQYFNGHNLIRCGTQAAEDSCFLMGVRQYHEKILLPEISHRIHKIEEYYDVTDKLEYIQYMNTIDKKPPSLGEFGDQHVVYDEKAKNSKKKRAVQQQQPETIKVSVTLPPKPAQPADYNIDDDFGILLDWATNLDEANLGDYEVEAH